MNNKKWIENYTYLILSGVFAGLLFILIYGWKVLNPFYVDWLISDSGDLSQHYVGWELFRSSDWQFPIGLTNAVIYPYSTSIIFTDSIPIFAIFFKFFLAFTNTPFQYFAFWGLVCFILQGVLSASILKRYTDPVYACLGSVIFVFPPIILFRMFAHTALAAQWIILIFIHIFAYFDCSKYTLKKIVIQFSSLGALAVSIHMYFVGICGVLICSFALYLFLKVKDLFKALISVISYVISALLCFVILGGFQHGGSGGFEEGYGYYSFNLINLWSPYSFSKFLPNFSDYTGGQYEGIAYLGFGVLLGIVFIFIANSLKRAKNNIDESPNDYYLALVIWTSVLFLIVFSCSNVITFSNTLVYEYYLPEFVKKILSIFRCTGRFIWPVVYIIMFWLLVQVFKFKRVLKYFLLIVITAIQVADLFPKFVELNTRFAQPIVENNVLKSNVWSELVNTNKFDHIALYSFDSRSLVSYEIGCYAAQNGLTMNNFYIVRTPQELQNKAYLMPIESISDDTIYIFSEDNQAIAQFLPLNYIEADNLIIGTAESVLNTNYLSASDFAEDFSFTFNSNENIQNGEDIDGVRRLNPGGMSYGPYTLMLQGDYTIEILGNNLDETTISCYADKGNKIFEMKNLQIQDDRITYNITLDKAYRDMEFSVSNISQSDIVELHSIKAIKK